MSDQEYDPLEFVKGQLNDEITRIAADVEKATAAVRARLPERHFREIYLPMFAGDEKNPYNVDLNHWVGFAGNPYREVDIIDEHGQVLFTVPPVLDREAVNPVNPEQTRTSVSHVIATAQQYGRIHPSQGVAFLDTELTGRALLMKVPPNVAKDLQTWNMIFTRYGRPPIIEVAPEQKPGAVKLPDNDWDFEPF